MEHPDWFAVGKPIVVERRIGRSVAWREKGVVVRHTATTIVVDARGAGLRFRSKAGHYHMTPAYLDYTTVLLPGE